tara:strand:- start:967 stop:1587 length:621 start_codon:yes stop_codon:yes gene_type:complete
MSYIYTTKNLSYACNNKEIIRSISCRIESGTITSVKGANGAGKTTFLKLLYGLYDPTSGTILRNFDTKNIKLAYIFQNSVFLNRSVKNNLEHVLYCKDIKKNQWNDIIEDVLERFKLNYMLNLDIQSLSGGELQLLALIRSILITPDILFYDEPSNNLDKENARLVLDIISSIHDKGSTIIIVSHDNEFLSYFKSTQINIERGLLV